MRKNEELKTERKTVLMTKSLMENIEQEAKERGIKANAVMVERLSHYNSGIPPQVMVKIQNFANHACEAVAAADPRKADAIQKEANKLWTYLE